MLLRNIPLAPISVKGSPFEEMTDTNVVVWAKYLKLSLSRPLWYLNMASSWPAIELLSQTGKIHGQLSVIKTIMSNILMQPLNIMARSVALF